jgi:hypothetical protein
VPRLNPSSLFAALAAAALLRSAPVAAEPVEVFFGGQVTRDRVEAENVVGAAGMIELKSIKAERVFATGGMVTLGDVVADEVVAAGGTVGVTATDVGSLEMAGGTVSVAGKIRDDVSLAGGTVTVGPETVIGGDVEIESGAIDLSAKVAGTTRLDGEVIKLSGEFSGDVRSNARRVTIAAGTVFQADLTLPRAIGFTLPSGVTVAGQIQIGNESPSMTREGMKITIDMDDADKTGAEIERQIEEKVNSAVADAKRGNEDESGLIWPRPMGMGAWFTVLATLAACGGLALAIAPRFVAGAAQRLAQQPLESLGLGLGSLVIVPLALFLIGVTIIGIPLAVLGAAAYAIGAGLGLIALCLWGGLMVRTFAGQPGQETRVHKLVGWTLMGFLALALVGGIPVVGRWIQILAVMTGAGAVLSTAWAARRVIASAAP